MKTDSNIKRVKVLGVGIDDVTMEEGVEIVSSWLEDSGAAQNDSRRHPGDPTPSSWSERSEAIGSFKTDSISRYAPSRMTKLVFTPGPEFLVTAQSDPEFMEILNASDLNIPDGYGLKIFGNITNIIPGVDFMLALCKLAQKKSFTVGLLGGTAGVAQETKNKLETMFPGIKIAFAIDGKDADRVVGGYDALRYVDILFVGLGHPKQEKFLVSLRGTAVTKQSSDDVGRLPRRRFTPPRNDKFCVAMGVGGSFDLISGKIKRAPEILQKLRLEWFWRLVLEPQRIKRIFTAVITFPFKTITSRP